MTKPQQDREAIIRVRGLKNQFGKQVVHENLDLDVWKGEVLGVVGGSGAGNGGSVHAVGEGLNGQPTSAVMTLPPLATLFLTPG